MRRRRVVVDDRRPPACPVDEGEDSLRNVLRSREMKRGWLNGDSVEPDHVAIIVGHLRVVMIVAPSMVRFEMPMNC